MKRYLVCLVLIALMALPCAVLGQGKITVDPNAGGAPEAQEVDKTDKRLQQKITYEAKHETVLAIIEALSEKTGVDLRAGINKQDWQVRDRKMSIFAKDTSLASLMNSISRVMKFKWSREGEDPTKWVYRVYMDRKTLLDAESRKAREEERTRKNEQTKRAGAIQAYSDAATMSPAELEKLKETNPFLYIVGKSNMAGSMGQFFGEAPMVAEAFTTGQPLTVSGANLSPAAQQGLLKSMQSIWKLEQQFSGSRRSSKPFPEDLASNLDKVSIRVNRSKEDMQGLMPQMGFMLGDLTMSYGGKDVGVPLIDPDSNMAKMIGKMLLRSQEEGKGIDELADENMGKEFMAAMTKDMKSVQTGEAPPEHPDDLALHAKVKLKVDGMKLDDVQAALAKASGLTIVSDSFGWSMGMMGTTKIGEDEQEIRAILDKIEEGYRENWEKHGSTLEFRDREWYRKRAAQIPEAWLEGWRDTLKKTGTLDIGDLAQIAMLTQEQLMVNVINDEALSQTQLFSSIFGAREPLRLYAQFSDAQRTALFSESGLDARSLSPEQWAQLDKAISPRNAAFLQSPDTQITLAATRTAKDKQFEYKLTATSSDEPKPMEFSFTTPKYVEPKKPEPKKEETKPADTKPAEAK